MLSVSHVSHRYGSESVLHDISLQIEQEAFTIISGESGSGKSTLLSIMSTLLRPTEGVISFDETRVDAIKNIDRFRNEEIGFVFQFHYLISHLSVYENIAMVTKRSVEEIDDLLVSLGILELKNKYPDEISGGQRQRAAIARAVINRPAYVFADEPTGNLDSENTQIVFDLLRSLKACVVVATHDLSQILPTDQHIILKDGRLC